MAEETPEQSGEVLPPEKSSIFIVGRDESDERAFGMGSGIKRQSVRAEDLKERVSEFLKTMEQILATQVTAVGAYKLDSVSVTAEISAKGSLSLLGSGGELAGKGGMTFTFKRH